MSPRILFAAGTTVLVVAVLLFAHVLSRDALPEGLVAARGTLAGAVVVASAAVPGRVIALPVAAGEDVVAGRTLAVLSSDQLAQRIEEAAAQVDAARSALAEADAERDATARHAADAASKQRRAERLEAAGEPVDDELSVTRSLRVRADENAEATAARAAAALQRASEATALLDEARAAFGKTETIASVPGTVTRHFVHTGDAVLPGAPLVELVDLDALRFVARVRPAIAAKLAPGLHARVSAAGATGFVDATIERIGDGAFDDVTPADATGDGDGTPLRLRLAPNPERVLSPGTQASAVIRWREDVPWPEAVGR